LRLVDPDNREPIDYETRKAMLAELAAGMSVDKIMKRMNCGIPKLWVLHKTLQMRREKPESFGKEAAYIPLRVDGPKQAHLIAFSRGDSVAVVAPRWNIKLGSGFGSTIVALPRGHWTNVFTGDMMSGGSMRAQQLFSRFPVALLVRDGETDASI
jgi:(1->4)-alpha-D-glucan 1-alpha-D-glucosylmutase